MFVSNAFSCSFAKYLAMALGVAGTYLLPLTPIITICVAIVLLDVVSSYRLSLRLKKKYPKKLSGKFSSLKALRVMTTLIRIFILIILAYSIDVYIISFTTDFYLTKIVAGVFCFDQLWSILENESSGNNKRWARLLQRVMIDKSERHFYVNLKDYYDVKENHDAK